MDKNLDPPFSEEITLTWIAAKINALLFDYKEPELKKFLWKDQKDFQ